MPQTDAVWRERPSSVVGDNLPDQVQDLVIGAGITGLTTGLLLARAGRRVAVVDAGEVGSGTTGASSAKVSLLHGSRLSEISRRHPQSVGSAYVSANREGQAWLVRFCQEHGVPVQTRRAITFAETREAVPAVEREYEVEQDLGLGSTWSPHLSVPFDVHAAIALEEQAQVDPFLLAEVLADQVQKHDGAVCLFRRAVDIDPSGDLVRVTFADGEQVSAAHVILATGTPVLDRGLDFAKLEAQRSYVLALADAEPPDGMFLSIGSSNTVSIRDVPERGLVLVGGFGHVTGRADSELAHVERLRSWARRAFPGSTEVASWSAQDYARFDALPEVAVLPGSDGRIHVATGYGKWGLTNGVASALTISAETLGGEKPGWAEQLTSHVEPRSLKDLVAFNGSVASHLVRSLPARLSGDRPICSHLGGVLCWNDAENTWDCPLHGSRFEAGGAVIEGPAVRPMHQRSESRSGA